MSIDPERLRAASQLLLGVAMKLEECEDLANTLALVEEVMPWFVLRRDAFVDLPEHGAKLTAVAQKSPFPVSTRLHRRVSGLTNLAQSRGLENALAAVIKSNIEKTDLVDAVDEMLIESIKLEKFDDCSDVNFRAVSGNRPSQRL